MGNGTLGRFFLPLKFQSKREIYNFKFILNENYSSRSIDRGKLLYHVNVIWFSEFFLSVVFVC